jgi:hypothetical protein
MSLVKPTRSSELNSDSDISEIMDGKVEEEDNDVVAEPKDKEDEDNEGSKKEDKEENVQVGNDPDHDEDSQYKEEVESGVASTPDDEEVENEEVKDDDESQLLFDQISEVEEADIGQFLTYSRISKEFTSSSFIPYAQGLRCAS